MNMRIVSVVSLLLVLVSAKAKNPRKTETTTEEKSHEYVSLKNSNDEVERDSGSSESGSSEESMRIVESEMKNAMKICNDTHPISLDYLTQLNKTGSFPPEANRDSKCYVACVLERLGVASQNGQIENQNAVNWLTEDERERERIDETVTKCADSQRKNNEDNCEKSYEFVSCLMKEEIIRKSSKNDESETNKKSTRNNNMNNKTWNYGNSS